MNETLKIPKTVDEVNAEFASLKSQEEMIHLYNKWSQSYDQDLGIPSAGYNTPQQTAQVCAEYHPNNRDTVRILDVACGTGLTGLELRTKYGFTYLDGLDASQGMLDRARSRNIYENLYLEMVGEEPISSIIDGSYEIVISTGGFVPCHLSSKCLHSIGRTLKPGGQAFISVRNEYLKHPYLEDLEKTMEQLERDGFWIIVERRQVENYYEIYPGTVFVLRKC